MTLGRNTLTGTATSLLVVALGIVVSIVLTRSFGAHDRGVYFLLVGANAMVADVVGPGVGDALATFAARGRHLFGDLHAVAVVAAVCVGAAGLALGSVAFILLRENVLRSLSYPELLVALLVVPATVYQRYWTSLMIGLGRISLLNWTTAALNIVSATAMIVTVGALGLGIPGFLGAWAATMLVGACLSVVLSRRIEGRLWRPNCRVAREVAVFGARSNGAAIAQQVSLRFDAYAVNAIVGTSALGVYSLATTVAESAWIPVRALNAASLTRTARLSQRESAELTASLVRLSTLLIAVVAAPIAIASPWLLPAVYGSDFRGAVIPFVVLLPGVACLSAMFLLHNYILVQMQRPGLLSIVTLAQAAIGIALFVGLIELWGIKGAAVASTITYALVLAAAVVIFVRDSGVAARRLVPTSADVRDVLAQLRRSAS